MVSAATEVGTGVVCVGIVSVDAVGTSVAGNLRVTVVSDVARAVVVVGAVVDTAVVCVVLVVAAVVVVVVIVGRAVG